MTVAPRFHQERQSGVDVPCKAQEPSVAISIDEIRAAKERVTAGHFESGHRLRLGQARRWQRCEKYEDDETAPQTSHATISINEIGRRVVDVRPAGSTEHLGIGDNQKMVHMHEIDVVSRIWVPGTVEM